MNSKNVNQPDIYLQEASLPFSCRENVPKKRAETWLFLTFTYI